MTHFAMPKEEMIESLSKFGHAVIVPRLTRINDGDEINEAMRQIRQEMFSLIGHGNFSLLDRYVYNTSGRGMGMHVWAGVFSTEADAVAFKLRFADGEDYKVWS